MGSVKLAIGCAVSTIATEGGKIISWAVMYLGPLTQIDAVLTPIPSPNPSARTVTVWIRESGGGIFLM